MWKKNTAVHCSLLKNLANIWWWVPKQWKCPWYIWRDLLIQNFTSRIWSVCFHISQQTAFWLHLPWAWEPGCCWCMLMLEHGVRQYYCRARDLSHCSSSLLLRKSSGNKTLQACIKLGKQVSASMWQVAQPGFWHLKLVLEPAVWLIRASARERFQDEVSVASSFFTCFFPFWTCWSTSSYCSCIWTLYLGTFCIFSMGNDTNSILSSCLKNQVYSPTCCLSAPSQLQNSESSGTRSVWKFLSLS